MKNRIIITCALAVMALLSSCSKMNDLHQPYLDEGEKVYAAKVDSVKAFIGVDSQVLDIYLPSQRVAKGLITWNLGADSLEFDIVAGETPKTVTIPGLSEGNYTYEIYTYDKYGNISLPFELTSNVISQATLDNKIEVACKSFYYMEYDRLVGNGGAPVAGPEAKIKNAQCFNGAAWFMWDVDALPGARVFFEYENWDGEVVVTEFAGESIKKDAWNSSLTDAKCYPNDQAIIKFHYWTEYGSDVDIQEPIGTTIDLGEEYASEIRYYEYTDAISIKSEKKVYDKIEDDW